MIEVLAYLGITGTFIFAPIVAIIRATPIDR